VKDSIDQTTPFDLPLSLVLGKMPQKIFELRSPERNLIPLQLPSDITVASALDRFVSLQLSFSFECHLSCSVLRLLDVGSKRFLTNKVDRSVTGLVAQQQCVGPLHTPLANVAVLAQSHFALTGVATAVGEQPIKGLINNAAQVSQRVAHSFPL
jgi:phosphoribosylformylglycinamidine synthase